ncbi:hypothetical protein J8I87_11715 [Paraburkholderia sp. LEh10]|uniref:hypothetical protein n=1 Tax=Paraburkholderia sp. LEh10 TaxID=2821353 RepID=UPI001AE16A09|nr:hypothetical protein [Paraburkholderia sp. LEh10]MBP0590367.1 hypothetical protein [Paraburkholderia sp. LEh10]
MAALMAALSPNVLLWYLDSRGPMSFGWFHRREFGGEARLNTINELRIGIVAGGNA